jgi:NADH-quinone oxidoreductase subunit L
MFFALCKSKLFFDEIYNYYVKSVQRPIARFLEVMELLFVSGLLVRGSAGIAGLFALLGKTFYNGKIHSYSFWFIAGTIAFLGYALGYSSN